MIVEKGMWITCNDPRYGWTVQIEHIVIIGSRHAAARYAVIHPRGPEGRKVKVRVDRIFTDGKSRKQGYNVVPAPEYLRIAGLNGSLLQ